MKNKIKLLIIPLVLLALLTGTSKLKVNAEEVEKPYSYGFNVTEYVNYPGRYGNATSKYIGTFSSTHPACFIVYDLSNNSEPKTQYEILFYLGDGKMGNAGVTSSGLLRSISEYENEDYDDTDTSVTRVFNSWLTSTYNNYSGSMSTNIPCFKSKESALAYFVDGDESGILNKPEKETLEDFVLSGFDCDNSIYASWADIICPENIVKDDVYVEVYPIYFLILEKGEIEQDYETPGTITVKNANYFSKAYADYFADNPYAGRCELTLSFTPVYEDLQNNKVYRGKSIRVSFDKKGNVESYDIPEGALTATHSSEFALKNFTATSEFHNWDDSYVHCYWNGSTISETVKYVYSDIKVQLYARTGEYPNVTYEWIDYPLNDIISINSNRLSFNLSEVDDYCRTVGYRFYDTSWQWENLKIRVTPYYKSTNAYVYGKSVEISLTKLAGIGSIMQSQGDALNGTPDYDNLEEDYLTDNSVLGGVIDDVFNDVSGGEIGAGSFDITKIATDFLNLLPSFLKACGQFPSLVARVYSFLPSYYANMLICGLSLIIILRILGR